MARHVCFLFVVEYSSDRHKDNSSDGISVAIYWVLTLNEPAMHVKKLGDPGGNGGASRSS